MTIGTADTLTAMAQYGALGVITMFVSFTVRLLFLRQRQEIERLRDGSGPSRHHKLPPIRRRWGRRRQLTKAELLDRAVELDTAAEKAIEDGLPETALMHREFAKIYREHAETAPDPTKPIEPLEKVTPIEPKLAKQSLRDANFRDMIMICSMCGDRRTWDAGGQSIQCSRCAQRSAFEQKTQQRRERLTELVTEMTELTERIRRGNL